MGLPPLRLNSIRKRCGRIVFGAVQLNDFQHLPQVWQSISRDSIICLRQKRGIAGSNNGGRKPYIPTLIPY